MDTKEIVNLRLINQQVGGGKNKTAGELVGWMGAMQAQDYGMAKWAVGVRLPGSTDKAVEAAIDKGEILRTHLMRPTWHLVAAADIHWMLALTAPKIKAAMSSRQRQLGLTQAVLMKSNTVIGNALDGGKHLTREELLSELSRVKIPIDENRASHLLARAELDGIVCSGATKKGKQTYALLEERAPKTENLSKEEASARLARTYFNSRGPATVRDFGWWSGLTLTLARRALEMIRADFSSVSIDEQEYWFPNSFAMPKKRKETLYLLPAYDEYTICYADRRAAVPGGDFKRLVSDNGIFRPILVINGQVHGIWKRTIKNDRVLVEIDLFNPVDKTAWESIEKAVMEYGIFLGKKPEIIPDPNQGIVSLSRTSSEQF